MTTESAQSQAWAPDYEPWRHGGWYVNNVRYPTGAVGCVSRNFPDRKWRIVCDRRVGEFTYPNRDAAARAEKEIADVEWVVATAEAAGHPYSFGGKGHPESQPCTVCGHYKRVHDDT